MRACSRGGGRRLVGGEAACNGIAGPGGGSRRQFRLLAGGSGPGDSVRRRVAGPDSGGGAMAKAD